MVRIKKNKDLYTTKLSSKGQVVLPLKLRENMSLYNGQSFEVSCNNDSIVLIPKDDWNKKLAQIQSNLPKKKINYEKLLRERYESIR